MTQFSIGLTGGIGSGKSTVADLFARHGAAVVDTDLIAHRLTGAQGLAMPAIRDAFGDAFILPDGALDRPMMRQQVFGNADAKEKLEAILHPLIRQETEREAGESVGSYLIFVVPLLVESGLWKKRVSRVLVVDCPEDVQIHRVMQRNSLSEAQVRAIMANQVSRDARLAAADDVIVNAGEAADLAPQVEKLHRRYLELAATRD